jgi:hypothetical protein
MTCRLRLAAPKVLQRPANADTRNFARLYIALRKILPRHWVWGLTVLTIGGAGLIFFLTPDMQAISQLGDFLSGVASAIAFIWLVAAYFQQGQELRLQRQELTLQRQALTLQYEELKRMSKFTALERASQLLEQFDQRLSKSQKGPHSTAELLTAFLDGMRDDWNIILKVNDPRQICEAFGKWAAVESACSEFLSHVVSAIEFYEEVTNTALLPQGESPIVRIYRASAAIVNIPFIRPYIGTAKALAEHMVFTEPGRNKLRVRGFEAMQTLAPGTIDEEALADLRAKVEAREAQHRLDKS